MVIMGRMAEPDRSCDGVTFNVTDGLLNHPAALLLFIYRSHPQSAKSEANLLDYSCAVRHLASFDRLARTPATAGLSNFRKSTRAARARRCVKHTSRAEMTAPCSHCTVISFYFKWTVAAGAGNQCNDSPVQPGSLFKPYN